jgi:hypothetical protein
MVNGPAENKNESEEEGTALIAPLSTPRPNGSRALDQAVAEVRAWLEREGIPVQSQRFTLHPFFMELLGLWMALTSLLLPIAALGRWGWGGLALALLALAIPLLEVRFLQPTITGLIRQPAENLVASFPAPRPDREAILCAHLDSKTELLDHVRRAALLRLTIPAMGLTLIAGALIAVERLLPAGTGAAIIRWLAFLIALPATAYGLSMGANLCGGRLIRRPSTGAVDNGAAAAVLMALARRLRHGDLHLDRTSITLLWTVGEEAQLQGALAYVRDREDWPLPVRVVNLEVLGQNGGYLLWEQDGDDQAADRPCPQPRGGAGGHGSVGGTARAGAEAQQRRLCLPAPRLAHHHPGQLRPGPGRAGTPFGAGRPQPGRPGTARGGSGGAEPLLDRYKP